MIPTFLGKNMNVEQGYAIEICQKAKSGFKSIRNLSTKKKNDTLLLLADEIVQNKNSIIEANEKDIQMGRSKKLSESMLDRLLLNEKRIYSLSKSVQEIANLPDPVGEVTRGINLSNKIQLVTKRVPIGVIMVIYESRPNVTIDVGALSFKSGNGCILRGGSEAIHSNKALTSIFRSILKKSNISEDALILVEQTDRSLIVPFLKQKDYIDLVVPRGGETLIQFVSENSLIPVIKHDKGICNIFIDESANFQKALDIVINAKTQRPGVCNAVENVFVHENFPHIKDLLQKFKEAKIELLLDKKLLSIFPDAKEATNDDFYTEFLDLRLSAQLVSSIQEAISYIEKYSSGHSEGIITENYTNAELFHSSLDSAAIFINCSTRFHDGGEFGLGAEVGISTGKMHVRGPMGLVHLTTTTTILYGNGQVRQ